MSIIYLDTNVDPRETKKETISMNIDERGGFAGGNESNIVKKVLIILTKRNAAFSRKNMIHSISDDYWFF